MRLFEELAWRGFVNQVTHDELPELLDKERFTVYCGFDPSAESLHIGNLLAIMGLVHFQRAGHRPIALVGGATGMIGDPSGKTEERQLLSREQAEKYVAGIRSQLERFLDFSGDNAAVMVNNATWLCELNLLDFLRDIGKHFSINAMMAKESVRQRLEDREHGISYTEFSYQLLQAYDFLYLHDNYGCRLQLGGSDQWGNIVAGMDLTRRLRAGATTFGLTFPLVTKPDGSKFGKTESGNVWLDATRTSPYRFYQFWVNQADAQVPVFLRYFTLLGLDEIATLERELKAAPEKRAAHRKLAEEVTRLVHGEQAARNAVRASQAMFGGDIAGLDDATLEDVFSEVPSCKRPRTELSAGRPLVDVLVESGVFGTKGEARRMIRNGGLYVNNERVETEDAKLSARALASRHIAVVRKGKRNYHLLKFVED
ncbi:MAG TPA: tyrosine--tRNA ligase [Candidatus Hydrogenedentes bacterium]|nr:tyrosine--tRNA ligase [Candidatus Hydrogenedentota bacterium]